MTKGSCQELVAVEFLFGRCLGAAIWLGLGKGLEAACRADSTVYLGQAAEVGWVAVNSYTATKSEVLLGQGPESPEPPRPDQPHEVVPCSAGLVPFLLWCASLACPLPCWGEG